MSDLNDGNAALKDLLDQVLKRRDIRLCRHPYVDADSNVIMEGAFERLVDEQNLHGLSNTSKTEVLQALLELQISELCGGFEIQSRDNRTSFAGHSSPSGSTSGNASNEVQVLDEQFSSVHSSANQKKRAPVVVPDEQVSIGQVGRPLNASLKSSLDNPIFIETTATGQDVFVLDHDENEAATACKSSESNLKRLQQKDQALENAVSNDDLDYVFDALKIKDSLRTKLRQDCGITTMAALLVYQNHLEVAQLQRGDSDIQKRLARVCTFYKDYRCEVQNDKTISWRQFYEERQKLHTWYDHAKQVVSTEGTGGFNMLSDAQHQQLYEYTAKLVVDGLSNELRDQCNFPLENYTSRFAKAIMNLSSGLPYPRPILAHGPTQGGKSPLTAVAAILCPQLRKAIKKLKDLRVARTHMRFVVIVDECDALIRTKERKQKVEQAFDDLLKHMPALKLFVSATIVPSMVDSQDFELMTISPGENYSGIENMRPLQREGKDLCLKTKSLSHKTGVPFHCRPSNLSEQDTTKLFSESYLKFPDCKQCRKVRLEMKSQCTKHDDFINPNRRWPFSRCLNYIPYTCAKTMLLYRDALSDPDKKKGVLVLDATGPRAWVPGNIFEKAVCIQDTFRQEKRDIAIVIFVGDGIYYRRPGFEQGRCVKGRTIGTVIEQLDRELGLEVPIFVFGWLKMQRCISFRSNQRVPTHFVLHLGARFSIESVIQARGRGTGNFKDVLEANGHDCVTILEPKEHRQACRKYYGYQGEVHDKMESGENSQDAIVGKGSEFSDEANFFRHTNRRVGQRKDLRMLLPDQDRFGAPTNFEDELELKDKYCDHTLAQRVFQSFSYLATEDGKAECTEDDIIEKFEDTYQDNDPDHEFKLTKKNLRECLKQLMEDGIIEKVEGAPKTWKAKSLATLEFLTNED
ncbi:expressed unknown protein [Seminavis robusta]|uniref:Uncharacterized protein n=1 Tax=Seminavis robusta TaxID=568900 RepID=A0A9N8HCW4_9STRA|nr:expressed unknown protein [Seminavis robusta]|eukprot:Sro319_g116300.1 n/a (916) ;mRNA; f:46509-49384